MTEYMCGMCFSKFSEEFFLVDHLRETHKCNVIDSSPLGSKNDSDYMEKPPLDLLTLEFEVGTAQALGFGAGKYGRHNFKEGIHYSRLIAAAMRHLRKYNAGIDNDDESGLSHLSHAAASLNMLMWMAANRSDLDDRYKGKK